MTLFEELAKAEQVRTRQSELEAAAETFRLTSRRIIRRRRQPDRDRCG
jgi:hypothetical protein